MSLTRTLDWLGVADTGVVRSQLEVYRQWLSDEAIPAGGLGPGERPRLADRHLADSLLFAGVWDGTHPGRVVDAGTGVGLPGIPLAILRPDRSFVLLDRSGRRVTLARRAVRILGLDHVDVVQANIEDFDCAGATVVSRASAPPGHLLAMTHAHGAPRELLVAGSHRERPIVVGFDTVDIPAEILDRPVWILRMAL